MTTLPHKGEEIKMSEGATDPKGMPKLMSKRIAENKDEKNKGTNPANRNIIIIRHGKTALNSETADAIRGWRDVPLDEKGIKEAKAVGKELKGLVDVIVSSDLIRTRQTAKEVSKATGAPIIVFTKALRPLDVGKYTGMPTQEVLGDIYDFVKNKPDEKLPGSSESFNIFKTRLLKEIQSIEKAFPNKRVAVVTHHRDERMYRAWREAGSPDNFDYKWDVFAQKGIPPGSFLIS